MNRGLQVEENRPGEAVTLSGLDKSFTGHLGLGRKRAVRGLALEVHRGEIFGLLGPNGAGKTTTIKMILGLLRPDRGEIRLLGRPPSDPRVRARLGYLPESPYFYDHLTAEEFLDFYARLQGIAASERRDRVRSTLSRVGLEGQGGVPLRKFSKGMVQRVGLAQAIQHDPELVILDEPMSGLDPLGRREVREIILRLRDAGRTVVFSSHILSDAEMLCSRVGIIARGRLVASGSLGELTAGRNPGSELVFSGMTEEHAEQLGSRADRVTAIADGRYTVELSGDARPEALIADLTASGARLVSMSPVRTTLEDVFMESIRTSPDDGVDPPESAR